jgi:hypothetical protein
MDTGADQTARMVTPEKYRSFARQADDNAEAAIDPELREHFQHMAVQWRNLADFTERTEAFRPGGPSPL